MATQRQRRLSGYLVMMRVDRTTGRYTRWIIGACEPLPIRAWCTWRTETLAEAIAYLQRQG